MDLFIITVDGSYGGEDIYVVKAYSIEEAVEKAKAKYVSAKNKFCGEYFGTALKITLDHDGISQLLTNSW